MFNILCINCGTYNKLRQIINCKLCKAKWNVFEYVCTIKRIRSSGGSRYVWGYAAISCERDLQTWFTWSHSNIAHKLIPIWNSFGFVTASQRPPRFEIQNSNEIVIRSSEFSDWPSQVRPSTLKTFKNFHWIMAATFLVSFHFRSPFVFPFSHCRPVFFFSLVQFIVMSFIFIASTCRVSPSSRWKEIRRSGDPVVRGCSGMSHSQQLISEVPVQSQSLWWGWKLLIMKKMPSPLLDVHFN